MVKRLWLGLLAIVLALGTLTAAPAAADAARLEAAPAGAAADDATVVPVQVTGDPANRWNLVVLGDGYTAAEMPKFLDQVDAQLNVLWGLEPYKSYRDYINVYAVETPSQESGISCDPQLTSPKRTTPLSMKLWSGCSATGIQRLLVMDDTAAKKYAALAPAADQILALANSDTYGGAGGSYATATGGNAMSALIAPHELGHSFGGLQDEYDYYTRGVTSGTYTGPEPASVHHTLLTEQQMRDQQAKWWRWLGERSESGGTIGRFEGGMYYTEGVWRPSLHSMMKTLGYYMDQVSREQMTAALSGSVNLIEDSTPTDAPLALTDEVWIDTVHPVYEDLDATWSVNGRAVRTGGGTRSVSLRELHAKPGDTIGVKVVDDTPFVRDPALRDSSRMTATRSWTVGATAATAAGDTAPAITLATPADHPVGADQVLWVDPSHPRDHALDVTWRVDGRVVGHAESLHLASLRLGRGTHRAEADVSDPRAGRAPVAKQQWTVDATPAVSDYTVSDPVKVSRNADGTAHYTVKGSFSLALAAHDDQQGALFSEFRVDGDGWFHYFGWPTDSSKPFLFTPTGTNVDDLIYGNLGTGGLSTSPFAQRTPGYGTHRIEYRSVDAAGNVAPAKAFTVTVLPENPPAPGAVPVTSTAVTRCVKDNTRITVSARNASSHTATLTLDAHGTARTFRNVRPGAAVTAVVTTGEPTTETGSATVTAHADVAGHHGHHSLDATYQVPYNRYAC
ncbi:M64 family metallopeptidase [Streptomyces fuscigenes]|uniref:M64 family metallopeptidase n=1 Tax=Streptomyces fuscigenes TaxID=1528880 RepID=UPI001F297878|nr:M64 family metallopeptidase [Streptomyces fuscigenes]MCF3962349.1 M64 family metallopeptidase [Streptomyces fuscigenes]